MGALCLMTMAIYALARPRIAARAALSSIAAPATSTG
jgi:hypothetical protein